MQRDEFGADEILLFLWLWHDCNLCNSKHSDTKLMYNAMRNEVQENLYATLMFCFPFPLNVTLTCSFGIPWLCLERILV